MALATTLVPMATQISKSSFVTFAFEKFQERLLYISLFYQISLLSSLSQFADLSQFQNSTGNMNINYGYVMDNNQNIQSNLKSQAGNNGQTSGQNLPNMLSMQQQSYMQQLLLQNFNSAQAAQATNSNSE